MDELRQYPLTVSAIIPVYNGAKFIAGAIESILAQTCPVNEIVVVDDGSTDETAAIVERYATAGVRTIRQENRGLSAARNRGIAETSGDLVAFLDADDAWLPDKTEIQVEYLASHPQMGLVAAPAWWWDPQTNRRWLVRLGVKPGVSLLRELMVGNRVGNASAVMVRRYVLDLVGLFDPAQIWAEDWDLWIRIASRFGIGFLGEPVILYRSHTSSLSYQRRWDRAVGCFEMSRQAIGRFRSSFWRPVLLLRAWSKLELTRAAISRDNSLPRHQYLKHAFSAFISYPFEEAKDKLGHFVRALLGESLYRVFRAIRFRMKRFLRLQPSRAR